MFWYPFYKQLPVASQKIDELCICGGRVRCCLYFFDFSFG